jgi:hypothetical protein
MRRGRGSSLALAVLATGFVFGAFGCATATVEEVEPGKGGVITVKPKDSAEARQKAVALMQDNCGGKKYQITKEGYAVVGSQTTGDAQSQENKSKKSNFTSTTTNSTSHDIKEWRLTYKCI